LFNGPYRAHDYLALTSLLMRVFEIATVDRPQPAQPAVPKAPGTI
jgi:hypothetical protein